MKGGFHLAKINFNRPGGVTLVELMVMSVIASLVALTVIQGFSGISRGIIATRFKSIATQMASQRMQSLKSYPYYRLRLSSQTVNPTELSTLSPLVRSDEINYPPTESVVNGVHFSNYTVVERVQKNGSTEDLEVVSWNSLDTGLKQITLDVVWRENGGLKRIRLSNLLENPNRSVAAGDFVGTVRDAITFALLPDVAVKVSQNSSLNSITDAAGLYKIGAPSGTYMIQAIKHGYFTKTSGNVVMASSTPLVTVNFDLTAMSSGTITGTVWQNDHLVISRVCGAKLNGGFSQEYVEIFNPTTWTWTGDGLIGLTFQRQLAQDPLPIPISINYAPGGSNIAPGGFFLFASSPVLNINGTPVNADAVWENTVAGPNDTNFPYFDPGTGKLNILPVNGGNPDEDGVSEGAGVLTLTGPSIDQVGWKGGGGGNPATSEGTPLPGHLGLQIDKILYRKSDVGGTFSSTLGPAYDSGDNSLDWGVDATGGNTPPRSTASAPLPVRSGTPSNGAFVFADDGLSQMVQTSLAGSPPEARFTLPAIATGTWNVSASSGSFFFSYSTAITAGVTLSTSVVMNTTTTFGFVSGQVLNVANSAGIAGISISPGAAVTNASGHFNVALTPGDQTVTANPNGANPVYTETSELVPVVLGQMSSNHILSLTIGGKIRGRVTLDGVTPLPNVPVAVTNNMTGYTADNAVSGADGYFIVSVPSGGIFTVQPTVAYGETATPLTTNVNVPAASAITVFAATYTVTSAYGTLSGQVSSSGNAINTGVLIIASTVAVPGTLLDIDTVFRASGALYYAGPSRSDGSYSFDLKNGTYTVSGWYTSFNGNTPTVTRINQPGVVILPRQTTTLDLSW
jgi:type II secretory pathway pseudopilin PulG